MDEEEKSIREILLEIKGNTDNKKSKERKFRIPLKARVGKHKAEKGWIIIQKINDNRQVTFEKKPIEEQTIVVDGIPRIVTPDETLIYKRKPFLILPSWSTKPFSPTDNYQDAILNGYASQGYKLLLNRIKSEIIKPKMKISGVVIFGIIIAIVALGYMAIKGGWFN